MGCTSTDVHEIFDGYSTIHLCDVHDEKQQVNGKLAYVANIAVMLQEIGEFTLDFGARGRLNSEELLSVCNLAADGLEVRHRNLEDAAKLEERFLRAR
jgi:hypothetical protein